MLLNGQETVNKNEFLGFTAANTSSCKCPPRLNEATASARTRSTAFIWAALNKSVAFALSRVKEALLVRRCAWFVAVFPVTTAKEQRQFNTRLAKTETQPAAAVGICWRSASRTQM